METKTRRKTGPAPRLEEPVKFSTQLTAARRDMLFAYSQRHGISVAEATRRAIDLLVSAEKSS